MKMRIEQIDRVLCFVLPRLHAHTDRHRHRQQERGRKERREQEINQTNIPACMPITVKREETQNSCCVLPMPSTRPPIQHCCTHTYRHTGHKEKKRKDQEMVQTHIHTCTSDADSRARARVRTEARRSILVVPLVVVLVVVVGVVVPGCVCRRGRRVGTRDRGGRAFFCHDRLFPATDRQASMK